MESEMPDTNTIDEAFVRQYESEVHAYYQRTGSKLLNSVRTRKNVKGKSTTFQTYGTAKAYKKTRNGAVQQSNPAHAPVEVTLEDWYVQIPIDHMDLLKLDHDEREAAVAAGAAALGQKTDELIIDALAKTTRFVGDYSAGMTSAVLNAGIEKYWDADVPEDDQSYAALSNHAWREFKKVSEVSNADFVGPLYPWLKGRKAYSWEDIVWMHHTGLPLADTDNRDNYLYHKSAIGHASGAEVTTDWWWNGEKQQWLLTLKMSQGADLIDARGVVEFRLDDDTPIT
jgi:hypothetical protein